MSKEKILILGIGNLLWADEGFGVRCVEAMNEQWKFPDRVTLMDGGTQGIYLLPHVQAASYLLIFDSIDWGDPPGTLRQVVGEAVPKFMGARKMSLHQTGFQEVLAAASLTGQFPAEIVLIGVQPDTLDDYGGSLRPSVRAQIPAAHAAALTSVERWGVTAQPRNGEAIGLNHSSLDVDHYELLRPDATAASRRGDQRFFPWTVS